MSDNRITFSEEFKNELLQRVADQCIEKLQGTRIETPHLAIGKLLAEKIYDVVDADEVIRLIKPRINKYIADVVLQSIRTALGKSIRSRIDHQKLAQEIYDAVNKVTGE